MFVFFSTPKTVVLYLSVVRQCCFSWESVWTSVTTYFYAALEVQVLPWLSNLHIWKTVQWKKCMLVASGVTASQKEKESTPRDNMSSYFWIQHSRGMWQVKRGGGKALASECMRKLIASWEEANAVYLGFLHNYNRQASRLLNFAALQIAWNDLVPLEGREVRGFVVGGGGGQSCVLPARSGLWAMWRFVKRNTDGF